MSVAIKLAASFLILVGVVTVAKAEETFDLGRFRGRIVVVDFWASWCVPCRRSFPWLNEMQARYADRGLVVVGINVDAERADADDFLREVPAQFRIFYDPDGSLAQGYHVPGMPSSFVFDSQGKLLSTHIGFKESQRSEREAELVRLLEKRAVSERQ